MTHSPQLPSGLIVSCQPEEGSPFQKPEMIAALAKSAEIGGAVGVRIRDEQNVRAVKAAISVPVIGITKSVFEDGRVLITPDFDSVEKLISAGADIVAVDGTTRKRPNGLSGPEFIRELKQKTGAVVMADIATAEEGIACIEAGADYVGTTLSGYTKETEKKGKDYPDYVLIEMLSVLFPHKVIAEGHIHTPFQAQQALTRGAHAVVVGTALTRLSLMVRDFISQMSV